jgi:hypothetical protein
MIHFIVWSFAHLFIFQNYNWIYRIYVNLNMNPTYQIVILKSMMMRKWIHGNVLYFENYAYRDCLSPSSLKES